MISLGIDSTEINRFDNWINYDPVILIKIFDEEEIRYCCQNKVKSNERFAGFFSAKEACYKAMSPILKEQISLLKFFKYVSIKKSAHGAPLISVNLKKLSLIESIKINKIFLSITHTKNIATAVVILI